MILKFRVAMSVEHPCTLLFFSNRPAPGGPVSSPAPCSGCAGVRDERPRPPTKSGWAHRCKRGLAKRRAEGPVSDLCRGQDGRFWDGLDSEFWRGERKKRPVSSPIHKSVSHPIKCMVQWASDSRGWTQMSRHTCLNVVVTLWACYLFVPNF